MNYGLTLDQERKRETPEFHIFQGNLVASLNTSGEYVHRFKSSNEKLIILGSGIMQELDDDDNYNTFTSHDFVRISKQI